MPPSSERHDATGNTAMKHESEFDAAGAHSPANPQQTNYERFVADAVHDMRNSLAMLRATMRQRRESLLSSEDVKILDGYVMEISHRMDDLVLGPQASPSLTGAPASDVEEQDPHGRTASKVETTQSAGRKGI
jgi:hypothetical protein